MCFLTRSLRSLEYTEITVIIVGEPGNELFAIHINAAMVLWLCIHIPQKAGCGFS